MPLNFSNLIGRSLNNFHDLTWNVFNEDAGDTYIIEKRLTASGEFTPEYRTSATVSRTSNTYNIKLPSAGSSATFYRLKIISASGKINYSSVVKLTNNNINILKAFVSKQNLYVELPYDAQMISLYNTDGKLMLKQGLTTTNVGVIRVPLNRFAKGTIVVKVHGKTGVSVSKVVY